MAGRDQLLSRISIKNFKSIREASVGLRQLTVLVGANSAGKSSLMQSVFLLAQIARGTTRPDLVSLNGMELNLGNFGDVRHSASSGQPIELRLTVPSDSSLFLRRYRLFAPWVRERRRPTSAADKGADEASWCLTLSEPPSELGVAQVDRIQLEDHRNGVHLEVWPNEQVEEAESLYLNSRRLGLVRGARIGRARLVSEVERATSFQGRTDVQEGSGAGETPGTFHAVAVENGFPVELYELETESFALARRWLGLILRRPTAGGLRARHRRRAGHRRSDVQDVGPAEFGVQDASERLFPDFRSWVGELERIRDRGLPHAPVEPVDEGLFDAIVRSESGIAQELGRLLQQVRDETGALEPQHSVTLDIAAGLSGLLSEAVHYLGPLREDPSPSYRPGQGGGVATLGLKGEFTVASLHANRHQEIDCPVVNEGVSVRRMRLEEAVDYWSDLFGLASEVRTRDLGRPGIELGLTDPQTSESRDLTSVGVGVSQLLPVIVLCLLAQPGELVLLEQPELHLHPAPQQVLGDFLLGVAESGRQLLVETHSEYLVNRLRLRIAQDEFDETGDLVQIWYARRDEGNTEFGSLQANRFGSFEEWPEGFFDQAPREAEEILRAAAEKRRKGSA